MTANSLFAKPHVAFPSQPRGFATEVSVQRRTRGKARVGSHPRPQTWQGVPRAGQNNGSRARGDEIRCGQLTGTSCSFRGQARFGLPKSPMDRTPRSDSRLPVAYFQVWKTRWGRVTVGHASLMSPRMACVSFLFEVAARRDNHNSSWSRTGSRSFVSGWGIEGSDPLASRLRGRRARLTPPAPLYSTTTYEERSPATAGVRSVFVPPWTANRGRRGGRGTIIRIARLDVPAGTCSCQ